MGWHRFGHNMVHVKDDEDLSHPDVQEKIGMASKDALQLIRRHLYLAMPEGEFEGLLGDNPKALYDEHLSGLGGNEILRFTRAGQYQIKIFAGQPVIYMAARRQYMGKPEEVKLADIHPNRQPVPCYDLHDNDVFKGFCICGLTGNRWSHPFAWQEEDPALPYGQEKVELLYPGGVFGEVNGITTLFLNLDVISEKNGRMDDQDRTEDELTYFDTESHWIDAGHNYEQPDYPEPKLWSEWPGQWGFAGWNPDHGLTGCADCAAGEGDGGALDVNNWSDCNPVTQYAFYREATEYCSCDNQCWLSATSCLTCPTHIGARPYPAHAPTQMHPDYCLFRTREMWMGHTERECFDMCIMVCSSWWVEEDTHGGCGDEDSPNFCQCLIEKTRYLEKYIYSDILVEGEVVWSTHAYHYKWQKWQQEGCNECGCAIMWENQSQSGSLFTLEDYAIVAPGFEDRGYGSGQHWMGLVLELKYENTYQFEISPPYSGPPVTTCACAHVADPVVEEYPYRWSIVFDDGTKWVIHDPGTDQDAVWTDTFKIYDFHGKPVYIGGIFIMVDYGNLPSKRIYFMYYDGKMYLEEGVEPDHNCAWFGCYEHDVYGTSGGLTLLGGQANGYGNGKCRAVGQYDTMYFTKVVPIGEDPDFGPGGIIDDNVEVDEEV